VNIYIFETVNTVFDRFGLKWSSLSGICPDGAPAMVGARKGLIGIVHERAIELQIHLAILTITALSTNKICVQNRLNSRMLWKL
jgi:hypothetical protein